MPKMSATLLALKRVSELTKKVKELEDRLVKAEEYIHLLRKEGCRSL